MSIKKKIDTGKTVSAWTYGQETYKGIASGVFDSTLGNSQTMVNVESAITKDGVINRIVINKATASKYGFSLLIDENA